MILQVDTNTSSTNPYMLIKKVRKTKHTYS